MAADLGCARVLDLDTTCQSGRHGASAPSPHASQGLDAVVDHARRDGWVRPLALVEFWLSA